MRKLIIAGLAAALLLAGCAAEEPAAGPGVEDMMKATDTTISTTEPTTEATTSATSTVTTATVSKPVNKAPPKSVDPTKSMTTATTDATITPTTVPDPKTIPLDVETKRGDGTLTFVKFEMRPESKDAIFHYKTSDKEAVMTVARQTSLYGKSGQRFTTDTMGGVGNKGAIYFQNITDFSDLSTVTLTYAFEGFDPVTVTFDIPGI